MILLQLRAGRIRLTLEHIDSRKPAKHSDRNKKTAQAVAPAQAVKVEVRNTIKG
jgi:hypothetical protein